MIAVIAAGICGFFCGAVALMVTLIILDDRATQREADKKK